MTPAEWSRIQQGIFAGESGGDYGALFGYQNRPNGRFSNVNLLDMTVDQALEFANPSGPYGQYVKGQVGRVATPMGAYQVVGTTLRGAKEGLGLTGSEKMTPELQDKIGQWIYKTQGTGAWEGYKPMTDAQAIGAETMQTLGLKPRGVLAPTQTSEAETKPMMQEEKPRGLLGSLGIQKMEEGAAGETGQRFYNRDSFKDTAAVLAQGFGRMGIMGMEEIADSVAKQRTEVKAKNKTMEMLSKLPNGEHLMRVAEIAGPKAAVDLYVSEQKGGGVGGVQSSSALPDQSGVVLTLRDGSIQVKTAGGQTLAGQEAMDFVRKSQETAANLQRDIYSARREGTNIAEAETGAAAAAAGKSGELTMDRGFKAYDDAVKAGSALSTMDEAIAALDSGAKSGIVYNMLPNVTEASASLSNAMNRMGLDVISSVTFGALSEAEMKLAMETAVPRGLAPDELRSWLVKKRDAQAKAREALMSAARYLTQPGNTLSGWMEQQASASAPAATAPTGGATRLKFNPETGEFE